MKERTGGFVKRRVKRDGRTVTKLFVRVRWTGADGKRHAVWRECANRTEGREVKKELIKELEERGPQSLMDSRKTFNQLADDFKQRYLHAAVYRDGQQVSGRRSLKTTDAQLEALRASFGEKQLRAITYGDLESFKSKRLATPKSRRFTAIKKAPVAKKTARKKKPKVEKPKDERKDLGPRALASVHRELALMRRMMNVALRENWILKNPFQSGDTLINSALERKRERILSLKEEARLLAACTEKREHLHAIIIAALDTAMRQGQLFSLRWKDVNFEARHVSTLTYKGRTRAVAVEVPITARLLTELHKLYANQPNRPDDLVFGITSNVKRSFAAACEAAGIPHGGIDGLTFHCLRHTAITRMVQGGLSLAEAGRMAGHTQAATTYRYVHATKETRARAAEIFEALEKERQEAEEEETIN